MLGVEDRVVNKTVNYSGLRLILMLVRMGVESWEHRNIHYHNVVWSCSNGQDLLVRDTFSHAVA